MIEPVEPDRLLTAVEVARILGVRPKRVYELGIPAIRISEKSLRWSRSDLQTWLHQRRGAA
jgi:predicted DNA-binding transcriptional regulator AlpA